MTGQKSESVFLEDPVTNFPYTSPPIRNEPEIRALIVSYKAFILDLALFMSLTPDLAKLHSSMNAKTTCLPKACAASDTPIISIVSPSGM